VEEKNTRWEQTMPTRKCSLHNNNAACTATQKRHRDTETVKSGTILPLATLPAPETPRWNVGCALNERNEKDTLPTDD